MESLPQDAYSTKGVSLLEQKATGGHKKAPKVLARPKLAMTAVQNKSIHTTHELHWTDMRALTKPISTSGEATALPTDQFIYSDLTKGGDVYTARVKGVPQKPQKREDSSIVSFHGLKSSIRTAEAP